MLPFVETSKAFPTIFALAKSAGLKTAASGDYGFLSSPSGGKCRPGVVDFECDGHVYLDCEASSSCNLDFRQALPETDDQDNKTAAFIGERISRADSDLLFAHFVRIDVVGHKYGWGSAEQIQASAFVDSLIGTILEALKARREPWLIIATSDHGGLGRQHGTNWNDDEYIPLIIHTMNWQGKLRNISLPASHCDVAPTALRWLGIPPGPYLMDGAALDGVPQGI
jgi:predicted AlkP superfamily pyrophosphatase or phosphodiesterase